MTRQGATVSGFVMPGASDTVQGTQHLCMLELRTQAGTYIKVPCTDKQPQESPPSAWYKRGGTGSKQPMSFLTSAFLCSCCMHDLHCT